MSEAGQDPGQMDGRTIANAILRVVNREPSEAELLIWIGIAVARLLEYQRALEALGALPPRPAPTGAPGDSGGIMP
jgi:hypothetical protein